MSVGVDHYENFPVASWLCPKAIRPAVQAIYHWARTADDVADEGHDSAAQRLATLASMRQALEQAIANKAHSNLAQQWQPLVTPLARLVANGLKPQPLFDLLHAFESDIKRTNSASSGQRYQDWPELLNYCSYSANPIGRLMLQLYDIDDARVLAQSDAVCTALQLINFWQDLSQDLARQRYYIPVSVLTQYKLAPTCDLRDVPKPQAQAVVAQLVAHAADTMQQGIGVVHAVPGRAGWELALVVAGGLRILKRIEHSGFQSAHHRPKLGKRDWIAVAFDAVRTKLSRATCPPGEANGPSS